MPKCQGSRVDGANGPFPPISAIRTPAEGPYQHKVPHGGVVAQPICHNAGEVGYGEGPSERRLTASVGCFNDVCTGIGYTKQREMMIGGCD